MKPCPPGVTTEVPGEGQGEGVSVYVTQAKDDPGGWWIYIYAETSDGFFFVRRVVVAPAFRDRSRVVARLVEPGAVGWRVTVEPPKDPTTGEPLANGALRVGVVACPHEYATAPIDVVAKGISLASGAGAATVTVPPGGRVRQIAALAGGGAATITITAWRSANSVEVLPAIPVPANSQFQLDADELEDTVVESVAFAGTVAGYNVTWVE